MLFNQRQVRLNCSSSLISSMIKQIILLICLLPAGVMAKPVSVVELETVTLQLKYYHQFQFAGYYAALEKGFYREVGLDVKLKSNAPGLKSPIDEVLSGAAQYGVSDNSLVIARLESKPVVVLANVFQKSPAVWIVREDSGISGLHDLVGKRVMHNPGLTSELLAMLQVEGIDANKINLIPTSFKIQDLIDGHIDAFNGYTTNEPYLLQEQGIPYRLISPLSYGVGSYGDVLFTSESEIENHPERAKAFRLASLKGWRYAMDHPDEIIDLIRTKYSSKKSRPHLKFEAEAMRDLILPDLVAIGHINPGRWRSIADKIATVGNIEANYDLFDGFIFDPTPKLPDHRKLYAIITSVTLLALLFLILAVWIARLNIDLKKSEMNIQERNRKLKSLNTKLNQAQEITHIGSYEWDLESNRTTWTDELFQIVGYPPYSFEPSYEKYVDCIHPDDKGMFIALTQRVLHEKTAYNAEYRIIRPEGEILYIHEQGDVKTDAKGEIVALFGVIQDISERAQYEEWLRKGEQYNRMLFEESSIGLALCKMNGELVDINAAFTAIIGRTIEETKTLSYWEITPEKYAVGEQTQLESLKKTGRYGPYEKEYIHADGHLVPVRLYGQILEKDGENFIWSNVEDITVQKLAEEALLKSEEQLRLLVEQANFHLWCIDRDLRFTQSLGGGLKGLGLRPNEVVGQTLYQFFQTESPEFQPIKAHLKAMEGNEITYETQWQDRFFQTEVIPQYDADGKIIGCIGVAVDTTQHHRVEMVLKESEELKRSAKQARHHQAEMAHLERLNTMGEMATGIAHELNQPLSAISTYAGTALKILKSDILQPELIQEAIKGTYDQAQRAGKIIRRIREFVTKHTSVKESVSVNTLIDEVVKFTDVETRKQGIELQLELADDLPLISADYVQIEQVLVNLIRNALDALEIIATEMGQIVIRTHINQEGKVQVEVEDTGIGMDADTLSHIFESYVSNKGEKGMGMGLSISRSIIEAHSGQLWAKSKAGYGATFYFTLPVNSDDS